jgi:hypothetical protein
LAPQLNRLADEAARAVREIERLLADDLGSSVPAEVLVHTSRKFPDVEEHTSLAYRRVGGKFRIAVVRERCTDFVNQENFADRAWKTLSETPWLECPRDEKLMTFPKVPELLDEIAANVEQSIAAIHVARPAVEAALNSLK